MRIPARVRLLPLVALLLLARVPAAAAQSGDNVLVVINANSQASVQIGEYYQRKRLVPPEQVVRIRTAATDTVTRADYERTIEGPIAAWLARNSLQDKVLYIVLTKDVPLRVGGTGGLQGTVASVDSELTLLYRKMTGVPSAIVGRVANPYFLADRDVREAAPFTRIASDTYLVTRLTGYTVDDVLKLVDRGAAPAREGRFVLDQKATITDAGGDRWLAQAAERLAGRGMGDRTVLEGTRAVAATGDPVLGYYSWGSNDPANRLRRFGLAFVNGAIGGMFVSTDGRTFTEPPAAWVPGGPPSPSGEQSLAADLIRDGITGVSAHVAEPFLDATIRPQILFPAYVSGFTLAEAYYLALPFLSWQTIVVGDPLCTPFPRKVVPPGELTKGIDPETTLPALFAERRLAVLARAGLNRDAVKLFMRAEAELQRDRLSEGETLLVRAADLEPRLDAAHLRLAMNDEARSEYDKAIDRYRRVLANQPGNVMALNNLAYALAVHRQAPAEALPFAERAVRGSALPTVIDTLGWIHHLLGDDRAALPLVERAVVGAGDNVDVLVHAAVVHAAVGDAAKATRELDAALALDPALAARAEVKALWEKLKR